MFRLQTIRWRLPLSYAGIALLTTIVLGGVLIIVLKDFYQEQERDYLQENVQAIRPNVERVLVSDVEPYPGMEFLLENYAFLANAQIRVLDADEDILVDTGLPGQRRTLAVNLARPAGDNEFRSILVGSTRAGGAFEMVALGNEPLPLLPLDDPVYYMTTSEGPPGIPAFTVSGAAAGGDTPFEGRTFPIEVFSRSTGGFHFGAGTQDVPLAAPQSSQRVRELLRDGSGNVIGYLEVSGGPALGAAILHNIRSGLLVAGLIASALAALVGWGISRDMSHPILVLDTATRKMSEGDLTVRARINRTDELGHLADAFNTMAERIEDTVATLKRFVADAAHELHTPITAIQTNLELAATETGNPQLYINRAHAQLTRLATMTDNLLNLTRLEAGVGTHETGAVNLNDLLASVSEFHASRAEQSDIQYTLNLPQEPVIIAADSRQLHRALDNLIDNALKFTGERGMVTITLTEDGHLSVADTGIGIPEADQPFIFDRFHRGRNASPYPGNGIGLMLTKTIIEQSGGTITFESSPAGTTFNVCLSVGEGS